MPKSANSIDCPCGGHYVKKNQSKHFKTKKHQKYEEEQLEKCANCKEVLTEDTHIFTLSKNEEEKTWCSTCFYDCAVEAREDGWTFDEQGEQLLDAEDEEEKEYECRHCEYATTDPDECDNCGYSPELGNCTNKECEKCYCRHCKEQAEFDEITTECSKCGMYQDIDVEDE